MVSASVFDTYDYAVIKNVLNGQERGDILFHDKNVYVEKDIERGKGFG